MINPGRLKSVFNNHQATKHPFEAYAPGPGFLDWESRQNPFRRYEGARMIPLDIVPPTGLYLLVRDPAQTSALQAAITQADPWQRPPQCPPPELRLYCLIEADTRAAARQLSCYQEIASDGCFSLAMLTEFTAPLEGYGPWFYPRLDWEAGLIGQLLYLEAEAADLRATGIGCNFDDPMHAVLGLTTQPSRISITSPSAARSTMSGSPPCRPTRTGRVVRRTGDIHRHPASEGCLPLPALRQGLLCSVLSRPRCRSGRLPVQRRR